MALRNPPSWLQNGSHPAENDRLNQQAIFSSTGVIGSSSMQVTQVGSPALSVNIAAGWASILSSTSNAGVYVAYNDATYNLAAVAGDATQVRKDIVVATVSDAAYSGSSNQVVFSYVTGTAGSGSAPSTPSNSILLATITVPAGASTILTSYIADNRTITSSSLVSGLALLLSGGTLTGGLTLSPSTNTVAPLKLTSSGTFLSSATGGAVEYDGTTAYLTPNNSGTGGHGVLPSVFYYTLTGNRTIGSSTFSLFGAGITLAGSTTYELEMVVYLTGLSSSAHTVVIGSSGSASFVSAYALGTGSATSVGDPIAGITVQPSTTTTSSYVLLKGLLRVNASGTYIPQITTSLGATPLVLANSYVKLTPVGANPFTSVGAWA